MLEMMPNVEEAPEAIIVMKGDKFVHDKLNGVVKVHETTEKSESKITLDNIVAAYQRIYFKGGKIRDTVVYHDDLVKAKSKSKVKSEDGNWGSFPGEMSKKTATNRAFDRYHKFPDNVVLYGNPDEQEITDDVPHSEVDEATQPAYSETASGEPVDTDTGEVYEPTVVAPAEPEQKKQKKQRNLLDED